MTLYCELECSFIGMGPKAEPGIEGIHLKMVVVRTTWRAHSFIARFAVAVEALAGALNPSCSYPDIKD